MRGSTSLEVYNFESLTARSADKALIQANEFESGGVVVGGNDRRRELEAVGRPQWVNADRKSTRLNSSHRH